MQPNTDLLVSNSLFSLTGYASYLEDGLKDASEFSITMGDNSILVTPEGAGAECVVVMVTSYDVRQQTSFQRICKS